LEGSFIELTEAFHSCLQWVILDLSFTGYRPRRRMRYVYQLETRDARCKEFQTIEILERFGKY